MKLIVQQNCLKTEQLTEKTWGRGRVLVVSAKWRNISLVTQGRNGRTTGDNIARTARRQLNRLENICRLNNPLSPTLADKHAPSKMNLQFCNIDGGKHALPCLQTRNHF